MAVHSKHRNSATHSQESPSQVKNRANRPEATALHTPCTTVRIQLKRKVKSAFANAFILFAPRFPRREWKP